MDNDELIEAIYSAIGVVNALAAECARRGLDVVMVAQLDLDTNNYAIGVQPIEEDEQTPLPDDEWEFVDEEV
jgi:hypothetical protein